MTLQQLRYIIEIAQSGSISLAAQRLFITQPSLSKSVADLEKEMGITIFYRGSRGVMLSPDGVKFLAYARQVVEPSTTQWSPAPSSIWSGNTGRISMSSPSGKAAPMTSSKMSAPSAVSWASSS